MKNQTKIEPANAVIVGIAAINQFEILIIQLDKSYKVGTIGVAEDGKITLTFEYATKRKFPVISIIASGGIRIQESTTALMQMAKMASAVKQHSNKGLLYISIVTNPTLGGASASFVSLADIVIAEVAPMATDERILALQHINATKVLCVNDKNLTFMIEVMHHSTL